MATFRRPQCTHVTMDRAYGRNLTCTLCSRIPDLGFVYRCRQDQKPGQYDPLPDLNIVPAPANPSGFYEATAIVARYLQMSESVVNGIQSRQYNPTQISKLIKQRQHVIQVITEVEQHMSEHTQVGEITRDSISQQNVVASIGNTAIPTVQAIRQDMEIPTAGNDDKPKSMFSCTFQVCHSCRPFFQDRMYASFHAVLNGETPQPDEIRQPPLIDPLIASTIGLRQVPISLQGSFHNVHPTSHYLDDNSDEISVDWTPTTLGAENEPSSESYPCPGPGRCPLWSRNSGCAYDTGFEDGRRAINHGYLATQYSDRLTPENSRSYLSQLFGSATDTPGGASSTASSVSLPTPATSMLASLLPTDDTLDLALQKQSVKCPKARSVCGELTGNRSQLPLCRQKSDDSFGTEIEIQGGVTLTEDELTK